MKKIVVVLFALSLVVAACATLPPKTITTGDLSALKGTWSGTRFLQTGKVQATTSLELIIANETLPLKGTVTLYLFAGDETRVYPFENGQITPQGKLLIPFGEGIMRMELIWFKEGNREKLQGSYFFRMQEGKADLVKE
jgi:hypothetical protein